MVNLQRRAKSRINGYSKARGEEVRIIAGAAEGGSALVIQGDSSLKTAADFRGKIVAIPRLGNTQDVVARAWLKFGGLKFTQTGGGATVLPTATPDQSNGSSIQSGLLSQDCRGLGWNQGESSWSTIAARSQWCCSRAPSS